MNINLAACIGLALLWVVVEVEGQQQCFTPCFYTFSDQASAATSNEEMCTATRNFISCIKRLCNVAQVPDSAYDYPRAVFNETGYSCDVPFVESTTPAVSWLETGCPGSADCIQIFLSSGLEQAKNSSNTTTISGNQTTCLLLDSLTYCLSTHCGMSKDTPALQNIVNIFGRKLAEKGFPCVRESTTTTTTATLWPVSTTTEKIPFQLDDEGICDAYLQCAHRHPIDGETCRFPKEFFSCVRWVCGRYDVLIPNKFLVQQQKDLKADGHDCTLAAPTGSKEPISRWLFLIFTPVSMWILARLD